MEAVEVSVTDFSLTATALGLWDKLSTDQRRTLDQALSRWLNGLADEVCVMTSEHRTGSQSMILLSLAVGAAEFVFAFTGSGQVILANIGLCTAQVSFETQ